MESGIYKIRNKKNDKVYIGSSRNIERRFREHKVYLKNDSHCNNHLQNSWNKYGKENFEFKPVLYCSVDDLVFYEQRTIDSYKACDRKFGYNIKPKADDSQLSQETCDKISQSLKGENHPLYGESLSKETREKMRQNRKDVSKENHPQWNRPRKEEVKQKISDKMSGKDNHNYGGLSDKHIQAIKDGMPDQKGDNAPTKKLNSKDVKKIKSLIKSNELTYKEIAKRFSVTKSCIGSIANGHTWSHIEVEDI